MLKINVYFIKYIYILKAYMEILYTLKMKTILRWVTFTELKIT